MDSLEGIQTRPEQTAGMSGEERANAFAKLALLGQCIDMAELPDPDRARAYLDLKATIGMRDGVSSDHINPIEEE